MKNPFNALHPNVEALSAYSDLNDVKRAASRLTRHVSSCVQCRAVVDELHALGDAARSADDGEAPADLWERIETAARRPMPAIQRQTPGLDSAVWAGAPALKPTGTWATPRLRSSRMKYGIGVVAVAAGLVALLVWPAERPLQAIGTSRLTFSPSRPVPGGTMRVRYRPASWLKGAPKLVLVGRWLDAQQGYTAGAVGDSIGILLPAPGGTYEASVKLPDNFLGVWLGVSDTAATESDNDGWRLWLAIGGTRDGKPSLPSLLATAMREMDVTGLPIAMSPRQSFDAADSLRRYFPSYPAGWAYARQKSGKGTLFERMVAYFQSSEKKYLAFYDELWPQKNLDAERLHEMATFGASIDEPAEANRWARRFATEHPEDPRAFYDLVQALHQLELTEPPGIKDTIRQWLPTLERMYLLSHPPRPEYDITSLITRYGDSAQVQRWTARMDSSGATSSWMRDYETNAAHRKLAEAHWLRDAQKSCARPAGKFPLREYFEWSSYGNSCERWRTSTFTFLGRAKLIDGDARAALAFADSAEKYGAARGGCGRYWGSGLVTVQASLRLGDTAGAERAAITRLAIWSGGAMPDSVKRWLGARVKAAPFMAAVDSARREYVACEAKQKAEDQARRKRYQNAD